jgi:hypothetical protein
MTSPAGSAVAVLVDAPRDDAAREQRLLDLLGEQALPPASASGRSRIMSPVVRITVSAISSCARPCAAARRARTSRACASASGLPRVPMRKAAEDGAEDCTP